MLKFDRQKQIESVRGALALRTQIEKIVDDAWLRGVKNICWLGIGGTWASAMQAHFHMKERSGLEVFFTNAAEYCATGDRRIEKGTFLIFSSVSGTTKEIVEAVQKAKMNGAEIFAFIDKPETGLEAFADHCINYPANEQLKFFMTADRFLFREGVMPEYEEMYAQYDSALPEGLASVEEAADAFAEAFARKHVSDDLHYFVGAGALYGATYSYGMCYWEEQHWHRTKTIHASEFFHGMFEIVGEDTPVTVYMGEDSQRCLTERVVNFLEKVCENYTVIDAKDYNIPGIDEEYRKNIGHLIMHAVNNRIDVHMEAITGHDMTIRRYYRKLDY